MALFTNDDDDDDDVIRGTENYPSSNDAKLNQKDNIEICIRSSY